MANKILLASPQQVVAHAGIQEESHCRLVGMDSASPAPPKNAAVGRCKSPAFCSLLTCRARGHLLVSSAPCPFPLLSRPPLPKNRITKGQEVATNPERTEQGERFSPSPPTACCSKYNLPHTALQLTQTFHIKSPLIAEMPAQSYNLTCLPAIILSFLPPSLGVEKDLERRRHVAVSC